MGEGATAGMAAGCQRAWMDRSSSRHSDALERQKLRRFGLPLPMPVLLPSPGFVGLSRKCRRWRRNIVRTRDKVGGGGAKEGYIAYI